MSAALPGREPLREALTKSLGERFYLARGSAAGVELQRPLRHVVEVTAVRDPALLRFGRVRGLLDQAHLAGGHVRGELGVVPPLVGITRLRELTNPLLLQRGR